jgi:hypothetical protein
LMACGAHAPALLLIGAVALLPGQVGAADEGITDDKCLECHAGNRSTARCGAPSATRI